MSDLRTKRLSYDLFRCEEDVLDEVGVRVRVAQQLHPHLGCELPEAIRAILSEMREFEAQAMLVVESPGTPLATINKTRSSKMADEALDVMATLVRLLCETHPVNLEERGVMANEEREADENAEQMKNTSNIIHI